MSEPRSAVATDALLASQAAYYRRRAEEYDATAYGDLVAAGARITRLVAQMQPAGAVLEIACGTGMWTAALADRAEWVTAIDTAPEAIAIARERVRSTNVTFEEADIYDFATTAKFDAIFFSAWLSHVPTDRFEPFWRQLRGLLADGGRVLFVDEPTEERAKEAYLPGADEVVERQLLDGSTYRIVKNFIEPESLEHHLRELGWTARIRRDEADWVWVYGEARPSD